MNAVQQLLDGSVCSAVSWDTKVSQGIFLAPAHARQLALVMS